MENDIEIVYADLPDSINGFCQMIEDNKYLIMINEKKSEEQKALTLRHELLHIELDHFHSDKLATELEAEIEEILSAEQMIHN